MMCPPRGGDYAALLRFLRETEHASIATQAGLAASGGCAFYRVGTLLPPYRYDMTRRLGAVFSDIGLPENYNLRRQECAKRLAVKVSEDK